MCFVVTLISTLTTAAAISVGDLLMSELIMPAKSRHDAANVERLITSATLSNSILLIFKML